MYNQIGQTDQDMQRPQVSPNIHIFLGLVGPQHHEGNYEHDSLDARSVNIMRPRHSLRNKHTPQNAS